MPSLRKRVSSYFRQLSFHNEPKQTRTNINENAFVTKYLEGNISLRDGPKILYGKNPTDLPVYDLGQYKCGYDSIVASYTGPNGGLTTVKRTEKHLSVMESEIDFIDNPESEAGAAPINKENRSPKRKQGQPVDNTTMVIKVAGQEYFVTNRSKISHNKSQSLGSVSDFKIGNTINLEMTKTAQLDNSDSTGETLLNNNNNGEQLKNGNAAGKLDKNVSKSVEASLPIEPPEPEPEQSSGDHIESKMKKVDSLQSINEKYPQTLAVKKPERKNVGNRAKSSPVSKTKSPVKRKVGKLIKVETRVQSTASKSENPSSSASNDGDRLPPDWNRKSELAYGLGDSLYDRNQITEIKNGDPIADCFGIIARPDSAILAVADGVNWGEKASVAAKSAIHGSLYYLNKTIFNDTKLFDCLATKGETTDSPSRQADVLITNTRDLFVCLLRSFTCAHDLILENNGMLTTLTVAVVLPLKKRSNGDGPDLYVCCVCNVGDTLAYVYSVEYGLRELTKGSHDITNNRDMRDALGALGPVDGCNPELSNLTISLSVIQRGDIVFVASDGITDNFDPNVCQFSTIRSDAEEKGERAPALRSQIDKPIVRKVAQTTTEQRKVVMEKPPRASKTRSAGAGRPQPKQSNVESEVSKTETKEAGSGSSGTGTDTGTNDEEINPLVRQFLMDNPLEGPRSNTVDSSAIIKDKPILYKPTRTTSPLQTSSSQKNIPKAVASTQDRNYKFLRSKTTLGFHHRSKITRNSDGIPFVTPTQRYELQLLLMEDILRNGISGKESPCRSARKLCENLMSFSISITSAKRHNLEDQEIYYNNSGNGVLVECSVMERKIRRKRALDKGKNLPGKLDHVTVVAYNVGNVFS